MKKKVLFSLNQTTSEKLNEFTKKNTINKSALVDKLILGHIDKSNGR